MSRKSRKKTKKTTGEQNRIFKPPHSPHFQIGAQNLSVHAVEARSLLAEVGRTANLASAAWPHQHLARTAATDADNGVDRISAEYTKGSLSPCLDH